LDIIVREMRNDDYDGVREVDEHTQQQYHGSRWNQFSEQEKEDHLQSRKSEFAINLNTGFCFVAERNDQVIGFIFAYETLPFRGKVHIHHIAIALGYQNQGIGMLLYKKLIEKAKKKHIKKIIARINLDNPASIRLHEKIGFHLKDRKEAILYL